MFDTDLSNAFKTALNGPKFDYIERIGMDTQPMGLNTKYGHLREFARNKRI